MANFNRPIDAGTIILVYQYAWIPMAHDVEHIIALYPQSPIIYGIREWQTVVDLLLAGF